MSTFLTLLVACCAVRGVSLAATPLRFMLHHDDPELRFDTPPSAAFSEPLRGSEVSDSSSSVFSGSIPEQPASLLFSDDVGRTLEDTRNITFPGEASGDGGSGDTGEITSSGDAAPSRVFYPDSFNRDNTPIELTNDCVVGDNLTISYNGTPWKLLTRGQCPEGEWAVMVAECQPGCRPQPCPAGQLEYKGRCVSLSDSTVCGEGQILYVNQRGSTFCDCEQNSFYYPWSGRCYARREQGPCDFGFFLDINQSGDVECMPNECQVDDFEKDPDSGRCYRKDFVGYCPVNSLEFHHNNQTAGCLLLDIRALFDRPIARSCRSGLRIDHLGECRQEMVVPSITSLPRSLTRGCRAGAIAVGRGPCRRVNNFF